MMRVCGCGAGEGQVDGTGSRIRYMLHYAERFLGRTWDVRCNWRDDERRGEAKAIREGGAAAGSTVGAWPAARATASRLLLRGE